MTDNNRMSKEEYLKKCEEVEDTAYAEKGHPQTFGNNLLLQNIDAFGAEIAKISSSVRALERSANDAELRIIGLEKEIEVLSREVEIGKTHTHDSKEESTT
tara:strand:- start:1005 stop:1307 length:303 start_codon:yes stop_codon:yes gene_type:complete